MPLAAGAATGSVETASNDRRKPSAFRALSWGNSRHSTVPRRSSIRWTWVRSQALAKYGIACEQSAAPKSDLYGEMLPLINSRSVALLDNQRLVSQLVGLERRVSRGGRDSIDHGPSGHDDVANAVAGVFSMLASGGEPGWLGFMREEHERMYGPDPAPASKQHDGEWIALRAPPAGCGEVQGLSGKNYRPNSRGLFFVTRDDAKALFRAGFTTESIEHE